uniref:Spastin isoform X2 n=1 Tax=Tanacetum cinerariifolium TaxID=118510 RepID=A0A6L2LPR7_TANCI|nr:spastin isoform X2 [Tanacetum cinerariifolium]
MFGATNKPQELDDAVLRRPVSMLVLAYNCVKLLNICTAVCDAYTFMNPVKRIYIPLPDANVRRDLLRHKLKGQAFSLPSGELGKLVRDTEDKCLNNGYSGSDLQAMCEEAAMMPVRDLGPNILTVRSNQVRRLKYADFQKAM